MLTPTSDEQFQASLAGVVPAMEQVREDVWAVGTAMPGGHILYSLLYLLRDARGRIHVIDPGWDSDTNWQTLAEALHSIDASFTDVASITATHLHPDHIGMATRLQRASGAPVQVHTEENRALTSYGGHGWSATELAQELQRWEVPAKRHFELERVRNGTPPLPAVRIDRELASGEILGIPGFDLVAMHTPGHTAGHISLREDARSFILTGDHILPTMHAGIGLGGATEVNPLDAYLASLASVAAYPDHEVLPGHGYRFRGLLERSKQSALHHLRRANEVTAVLAEYHQTSIWDIASRLTWTAGWENLQGFYLHSALAQTAMLKDFVEAGGLGRAAAVFQQG